MTLCVRGSEVKGLLQSGTDQVLGLQDAPRPPQSDQSGLPLYRCVLLRAWDSCTQEGEAGTGVLCQTRLLYAKQKLLYFQLQNLNLERNIIITTSFTNICENLLLCLIINTYIFKTSQLSKLLYGFSFKNERRCLGIQQSSVISVS